MAAADYQHCCVCGCKTVYDANVDWDDYNVGDIETLCRECSKTHVLTVKEKEKERGR